MIFFEKINIRSYNIVFLQYIHSVIYLWIFIKATLRLNLEFVSEIFQRILSGVEISSIICLETLSRFFLKSFFFWNSLRNFSHFLKLFRNFLRNFPQNWCPWNVLKSFPRNSAKEGPRNVQWFSPRNTLKMVILFLPFKTSSMISLINKNPLYLPFAFILSFCQSDIIKKNY